MYFPPDTHTTFRIPTYSLRVSGPYLWFPGPYLWFPSSESIGKRDGKTKLNPMNLTGCASDESHDPLLGVEGKNKYVMKEG